MRSCAVNSLPQSNSSTCTGPLCCSFTLYIGVFSSMILGGGTSTLRLTMAVIYALNVLTSAPFRCGPYSAGVILSPLKVNAVSGVVRCVLDISYNASRTASVCVGHSLMSLSSNTFCPHCLSLSTLTVLSSAKNPLVVRSRSLLQLCLAKNYRHIIVECKWDIARQLCHARRPCVVYVLCSGSGPRQSASLVRWQSLTDSVTLTVQSTADSQGTFLHTNYVSNVIPSIDLSQWL
ncbi:hypothetical protein F4604DRAFT_663674 [Suillus subluteus]|nr:hypothetical protein F4604DRAFT_663674 [Suillus subluteus]